MVRIRCFLLEPTERVRVRLRRYSNKGGPCPLVPGTYSYHTAFSHLVSEEPAERSEEGYIQNGIRPREPKDDPRWPQECACGGYTFTDEDEWDRFTEQIYRRADTGEETTIRDAPPGAMWEAWWLDQFYVPQGPHCLAVKTPGGEWTIDGQARNCGMPDDHRQEHHHCWVRTGTPPDVTVGKDGGPTCSAGAGSIQCGNYHGFLRGGFLED